MPLTKEEKEKLRFECAMAKSRCKETWATILEIRRVLSSYEQDHLKYSSRYKIADRKLAEEEKMVKLAAGKKKNVSVKLTEEQIAAIAFQLGVEIRIEGKEV